MSGVLGSIDAAPPLAATPDLKSAVTDRRRAVQAAHEFEGLLLGSWLEAAEASNKALSGSEESAGSATLGALGIHALASGIAGRGGIGLAKLLLEHLPLGEGNGPKNATSEVPEHGSDQVSAPSSGRT